MGPGRCVETMWRAFPAQALGALQICRDGSWSYVCQVWAWGVKRPMYWPSRWLGLSILADVHAVCVQKPGSHGPWLIMC
jgi:hypothetical protein